MRIRLSSRLTLPALGALAVTACSPQQPNPQPSPSAGTGATAAATAPASRTPQRQYRPQDTEVWTPVPAVVTPGPAGPPAAPPSDAIVLFGGGDMSEWVQMKDKSPAAWPVSGGVVTVNKQAGGIQTKRSFTNYQLHIEWRIPEGITGSGQGRGNSGIFLASTGEGDTGYEIQVLDSYNNPTYVNGQAASIYKQYAPLVNAMRRPGEWQVYDIIWTAPTFNTDGSVKSPAYLTAFHNGVLVQNNVTIKGHTPYIGPPQYSPHGATPIKLQSHGDPSPPISFRNIWLRPL